MPKKPRRQHRVGALEQPWRGQRPTCRERHDDRLAKVKDRFGKRALATGQADVDSARGLSTHRRALAKAEHENLGAGAQIYCCQYPARLLSINVDARGMIDLALR
jgi:hypothetical protein